MSLNRLFEYDWFTREAEAIADQKEFESNFQGSGLTQQALLIYIEHELAKLDNSITSAKLKELPDRGEVVLMVVAQKEALQKLKKLLEE